MKRVIKKWLKAFVEWILSPEYGELSDLETLQAEKLAMANAIEMLANLMIQSNGLMSKEMMAAQFRSHADYVSKIALKKEGFERLSFQITATQLDDIASNIMGNNNNTMENKLSTS